MIDERIKRLGFLLGHTSRFFKSTINKAFLEKGYDVTIEQFSIIMFLWHKDGVNQQLLADNALKEKTTVLRLIDSLEKYGYIRRDKDPNDRRNNLIFLTDAGKQLRIDLIDTVDDNADRVFNGFTVDEKENLERLLSKMYENLRPENYTKYESINFNKDKCCENK